MGILLGQIAIDWPSAIWTIAAGLLCNVSCALLGCYLVLRKLSLLGDAISHAVLPGIALAFLLTGRISGIPIVLGAMLLGVATAFLTETLRSGANVPEDASMGVVFTSLFAAGVIMITRGARQVDLDPGCVLYGLIEFIPLDTTTVLGWAVPRALVPLSFALALTVLFVGLFWKELKIVSFDPQLAAAMGINAALVHYSLMALVAGVSVAAFEAVGSILVVAMLIVPAAAAHLLTDRLGWMLVWSVAVAASAAVAGYFWALYLNTSVAGLMAVTAGLEFALIVLFAPRHGLVGRMVHQWSLALRIVGEDILALTYRLEERSAAFAGVACRDALRAVGAGAVGRLAVLRLYTKRLVQFDPQRRLHLTEKGRAKAGSLVRSHRLWELYLRRYFQLPLDHLHAPAERLEHYIDPRLQQRLADALRDPGEDPHGKPIPPAAPS